MTATEFQSMLHAGKVSGTGEQELKKHLSTHLGQGFCPTQRSIHMLLEGHANVHYGSLNFTYDRKEKSEFIEWTEKNIDKEISIYLQRHLTSKFIQPSNVIRVQVVIGGNHGETAFQFGASVSVELADNCIIDFEVLVCELICRKDTGRLIEETILTKLSAGLEVISTFDLHIYNHHNNRALVVKYCRAGQIQTAPTPSQVPISEVFVTGNLAFQAMALGKESMAGPWCMQCKATRLKFTDDCKLWTMEDLVRCGKDAEKNKGDPVLGVKKKPWWPFRPLAHYMVPLLHCEIGVGNQLLDWLRAIIMKHIAQYSPGKEALITSITTLKRIITATANQRDDWDNSAEGGKKQKIVMMAVTAYSRRCEIILENNNEQDKRTHRDNESALAALNLHRTHLVQKLKKARRTLSEQQLKLKVIQTAKGKKEHSVESKMFNVLKK
jgi:hypothetical protein